MEKKTMRQRVEGTMSPQSGSPNIDFEEWSALARSDSDAFEARRAQTIKEFIDSVPAERRERLRRLQWRIDQLRRTSKTPLAACVRINRLMWESVCGHGGLLETLERLSAVSRDASPPMAAEGAKILALTPTESCNPR